MSLAGALWTLWERTSTTPAAPAGAGATPAAKTGVARRHHAAAPAGVGPRTPPWAIVHQAVADWLLRLKPLRYARDSAVPAGKARLATLQREFNQLAWPP